MADGTVGRDGCLFPQKQHPFFFSALSFLIKMSAPEAEGGQDRDDILGFPGDGYQDPQDGGPLETMDEDLDSGALVCAGTPCLLNATAHRHSSSGHKCLHV